MARANHLEFRIDNLEFGQRRTRTQDESVFAEGHRIRGRFAE